MMSIQSIVFRNENWGLCCENDITSEELKITKEGAIIHRENIGHKNRMIHWYDYQIEREKAREFMNRLVEYYRIQDWEDDYAVPIEDGMHWEICYEEENHKSRKIEGTVRFPVMADELAGEVLSLAEYVPRPWVLCKSKNG